MKVVEGESVESLSHAIEYLVGIAVWQQGSSGVLDVIPLAIAVFSTATLVLVEWLNREREHGLDIRHLSLRARWAAKRSLTGISNRPSGLAL